MALMERAERDRGKRLLGIRSLECNFNNIRRTYNPHFHLIVPDLETAEIIIKEWLKIWTPKHAIRKCQDIRPVKDAEKDLIETIKYGTKIFSDPTVNKFKNKTVKPFIYVSAIDNILHVMRNKRLFDHFGFKVPKRAHEKEAKDVDEYESWFWQLERSDWENIQDSKETLFRHDLEEEIRYILENNIETDLQ